MNLDDAAFFTRSRPPQAHDDDEEGMSEAALLKRKREERSKRAAARASAKEDANTPGNHDGRRYVPDHSHSFFARDSRDLLSTCDRTAD
jgi:3',5'-cyclic AMP phosphodiesterase CpdA